MNHKWISIILYLCFWWYNCQHYSSSSILLSQKNVFTIANTSCWFSYKQTHQNWNKTETVENVFVHNTQLCHWLFWQNTTSFVGSRSILVSCILYENFYTFSYCSLWIVPPLSNKAFFFFKFTFLRILLIIILFVFISCFFAGFIKIYLRWLYTQRKP